MKNLTILHGYRYVSPRDVARLVLQSRRVCRSQGKYLDCVTRWSELRQMTQKFSSSLKLPHIVEPEAFLDWYRQNHVTLLALPEKNGIEKDNQEPIGMLLYIVSLIVASTTTMMVAAILYVLLLRM